MGFSGWELLIILIIVALLFGTKKLRNIGTDVGERLPETLRGINLWVGRIKASLSSAKREIEDELGMDEVREQLHNEKILRDLESTKQEAEKLITEAKTPFKEG